MKFKSKILTLALSTLIILGSCKKSIDNPLEKPCYVESYTEYLDNIPYINSNTTFDNKGRLILLLNTYSKDNDTKTVEISYQPTKIIVFSTSNINNVIQKYSSTKTLNADGKIIYSDSYNEPLSLEYNSDGYLQKSTIIVGGSSSSGYKKSSIYTYANGNLIKIESSTVGSKYNYSETITFLYNNDEINNLIAYDFIFSDIIDGYGHLTYLWDYLGKRSRNTVNKVIQVYKGSSGSNNTIFSYERDLKGNIVSVKKRVNSLDSLGNVAASKGERELKLDFKCN